MTAGISRGSVGPFESIVLENEYLRAVILPGLGGRVWELEDLKRGRQWIWHRDIECLRAEPVGSNYDDSWAGGWEELFPNDAPETFEGRRLPDHGEWWATPWHITGLSVGKLASVRLSADLSTINVSCYKEYRLGADDATLVVNYSICSRERNPFHFLFKQHLPIWITPECLLSIPRSRVESVDPSFGTIVPDRNEFDWPFARNGVAVSDLRRIPDKSRRQQEFIYIKNLAAPWCGIDDTRRRASIRMNFDSNDFPFVWLFLTYGGWRGYYTAVLEPCTNMPKSLSEAVRLGQSARLDPGQEFATTVNIVLSDITEIDT